MSPVWERFTRVAQRIDDRRQVWLAKWLGVWIPRPYAVRKRWSLGRPGQWRMIGVEWLRCSINVRVEYPWWGGYVNRWRVRRRFRREGRDV